MMSHFASGHHPRGRGGWGRGGCGKGDWGNRCGGWDKPREGKKALITAPQDILRGKPGDIIFADIEVQNGNHWPWREGCSLQSCFQENTALIIEEVIIPIDFPVKEQEKFKLCVALKIRDSAISGDTIYPAQL